MKKCVSLNECVIQEKCGGGHEFVQEAFWNDRNGYLLEYKGVSFCIHMCIFLNTNEYRVKGAQCKKCVSTIYNDAECVSTIYNDAVETRLSAVDMR